MDCESLKKRLEDAGCSESHYSIGTLGDDTFCLDKLGNEWWVFYTERGIVNDPEFRSESEAEACAYLWEKMQHIRHDHIVGLFHDPAETQEFSRALHQRGMKNLIDHIPSPIVHPTLYRVFVFGQAIFEAQRHFPHLPVRQWPPESTG